MHFNCLLMTFFGAFSENEGLVEILFSQMTCIELGIIHVNADGEVEKVK